MLPKRKKKRLLQKCIIYLMVGILTFLPLQSVLLSASVTVYAAEGDEEQQDAAAGTSTYNDWLDGWATGTTYDESTLSFGDFNETDTSSGVIDWLASTIEFSTALLLKAVVGGFIFWLSDDLDATVDTVVYGRVALGESAVSSFQFGLESGNVFGVVGSILYAVFRGIIFALMAIQFLYIIASYALKGTGKGRSDLKSSIYNFLFMFVMLYAMPLIVSVVLFVRDAMLRMILELSQTVCGVGSLGIMDMIVVATADDYSLAGAIVLCCVLGGGIYFAIDYVRIAIAEAYLFGSFPIVAFRSFSDKQVFNKWIGQFVTNLFVPALDAIGLFIVVLLNSQHTISEGKYGLITIFAYLSIIPCRNIIIQLFGMPIPGKGFNLMAAALLASRAFGGALRGVGRSGGNVKGDGKNSGADGKTGEKTITNENKNSMDKNSNDIEMSSGRASADLGSSSSASAESSISSNGGMNGYDGSTDDGASTVLAGSDTSSQPESISSESGITQDSTASYGSNEFDNSPLQSFTEETVPEMPDAGGMSDTSYVVDDTMPISDAATPDMPDIGDGIENYASSSETIDNDLQGAPVENTTIETDENGSISNMDANTDTSGGIDADGEGLSAENNTEMEDKSGEPLSDSGQLYGNGLSSDEQADVSAWQNEPGYMPRPMAREDAASGLYKGARITSDGTREDVLLTEKGRKALDDGKFGKSVPYMEAGSSKANTDGMVRSKTELGQKVDSLKASSNASSLNNGSASASSGSTKKPEEGRKGMPTIDNSPEAMEARRMSMNNSSSAKERFKQMKQEMATKAPEVMAGVHGAADAFGKSIGYEGVVRRTDDGRIDYKRELASVTRDVTKLSSRLAVDTAALAVGGATAAVMATSGDGAGAVTAGVVTGGAMKGIGDAAVQKATTTAGNVGKKVSDGYKQSAEKERKAREQRKSEAAAHTQKLASVNAGKTYGNRGTKASSPAPSVQTAASVSGNTSTPAPKKTKEDAAVESRRKIQESKNNLQGKRNTGGNGKGTQDEK